MQQVFVGAVLALFERFRKQHFSAHGNEFFCLSNILMGSCISGSLPPFPNCTRDRTHVTRIIGL